MAATRPKARPTRAKNRAKLARRVPSAIRLGKILDQKCPAADALRASYDRGVLRRWAKCGLPEGQYPSADYAADIQALTLGEVRADQWTHSPVPAQVLDRLLKSAGGIATRTLGATS